MLMKANAAVRLTENTSADGPTALVIGSGFGGLAATYAAQGLRITAVAPGLSGTPMQAKMTRLTAMLEGAAPPCPFVGLQLATTVA